jgi:hypothetical protein
MMRAIPSTRWARVLGSPVAQVLNVLEAAGATATMVGGRLRVKPSGIITAEQTAILKAHRVDVELILAVCDCADSDGLVERYHSYASALAAGQTAPALVPGLPWQLGACGTCYQALPPDRSGRCDLCGLALRLAWPEAEFVLAVRRVA